MDCAFTPLVQLAAYVGLALLAGGCGGVLGYAHGKDCGRAEGWQRGWAARGDIDHWPWTGRDALRPPPPPNTTSIKGGT